MSKVEEGLFFPMIVWAMPGMVDLVLLGLYAGIAIGLWFAERKLTLPMPRAEVLR